MTGSTSSQTRTITALSPGVHLDSITILQRFEQRSHPNPAEAELFSQAIDADWLVEVLEMGQQPVRCVLWVTLALLLAVDERGAGPR